MIAVVIYHYPRYPLQKTVHSLLGTVNVLHYSVWVRGNETPSYPLLEPLGKEVPGELEPRMARNSSFDSQSSLLIDIDRLEIALDTSALYKNSIWTSDYVPLCLSTQVVPVYSIPTFDGELRKERAET